jgi:hypothetical protein
VQEVDLLAGRDDEQPVGLGGPARHLGEELRGRDPDRDRQPDPLARAPSEPRADLGRTAADPGESTQVEERLLHPHPLDGRRGLLEHPEQLLARFDVGRPSGLYLDRIGTEPARARASHSAADATRLGLVAGGEHHPATDDHRPPAEPRVIALLDRGIERVGVGVHDRQLAWHEHMFAYAARALLDRLSVASPPCPT